MPRPRPQSWITLLVLYSITALVEGIGVSQIFAFLPLYLRGMGVPAGSIPRQVGLLSSLVFLLGLPIVPLWGVWADKYSRKAVIVRSALVEAAVFAFVALSRTPLQLAGSLLLVGFQLGNTGVMLAALRDVTPVGRLGLAVGVFAASSPLGFAAGPAIGGLMIDRLGTPISTVYWVAAGLSVAVALMLLVGSREVRPAVAATGKVLRLAYGAVRGIFADRLVRRLFAVYGLALLARQMSNPYVPLLVERIHGGGPGLAGAIALVVGVAALAGALISPPAGLLGDRVGFRRVLVWALSGGAAALVAQPLVASVAALAGVAIAFVALSTSAASMIYGLLALEVAPERRSATLNLVLLPLYVAGIAGPALGAAIVSVGLPAVFFAAGALFVSAIPLALSRGRGAVAPEGSFRPSA